MVLVDSRIKKPIVHQVINCLSVRLSVSIAQHRDVSGIYRISDSLTPERGEMVRLNTTLIGTPSGYSASLF